MGGVGLFVRLTFVSLFWGGTFIAGRVATRTLDPIVIAFFRFLLASIFLVAYSASRQRHQGRPDLRQIGMLAAAGLAGIRLVLRRGTDSRGDAGWRFHQPCSRLGVLLGALILDEKIAAMALVGGAVIVGGGAAHEPSATQTA